VHASPLSCFSFSASWLSLAASWLLSAVQQVSSVSQFACYVRDRDCRTNILCVGSCRSTPMVMQKQVREYMYRVCTQYQQKLSRAKFASSMHNPTTTEGTEDEEISVQLKRERIISQVKLRLRNICTLRYLSSSSQTMSAFRYAQTRSAGVCWRWLLHTGHTRLQLDHT
jgi:hypothetical protein